MNSSAVLVSLCVIRIEICDSELEETTSKFQEMFHLSPPLSQLLINKSFHIPMVIASYMI